MCVLCSVPIFSSNFSIKMSTWKRKLGIMSLFVLVEFFMTMASHLTWARYNEMISTFPGFVVFLLAPLWGTKVGEWGAGRILNVGIFTTAFTSFMIAFLTFLKNESSFFWLALFVSFLEAGGNMAFVVSALAITGAEFRNSHVATAFGVLEMITLWSSKFGPTVWLSLYWVQHLLPFFLTGGVLFILGILSCAFLPDYNINIDEPTVPGGCRQLRIFGLLRMPRVAVIGFGIVAVTAGLGFSGSNFYSQLKNADVHKRIPWIGSAMVFLGAAVTAPLWGLICDKWLRDSKIIVTFVGAALTIVGLLLVATLKYASAHMALAMFFLGVGATYIGFAATLVSAFPQIIAEALDRGHPNDISTFGLASGLLIFLNELGRMIVGGLIGGALNGVVGYQWTTGIFVIQLLVLLLLLILLASFYKPSTRLEAIKAEDGQTDEVMAL